MKIGLIGFEFESANKGCEALVYSFISIIKDWLAPEDFIYNFSGTNLGVVPDYFGDINFVNVYPKTKDLKLKYIRALLSCDVIFDVTMGDSFSDIYSEKYFKELVRHKKLAQFCCKNYVLLPQTYGPFINKVSSDMASTILKKASSVFSRDEMSKKMLEKTFKITDVKLVSDMAFVLPYEKSAKSDNKKKRIGINVSGMLYKGGFNSENQFDLVLDYKKFISIIIERLIDNYEVHLIPHVIDLIENAYDDDYRICKKLNNEYPMTRLASAFVTPIDAKNYISQMDIFVGARMHATIAAFSSGVVTIPVSYSRKFEGLYGSLNYPYVINGKYETTESAVEKTIEYINNCTYLQVAQRASMEIIEKKNALLLNEMCEIMKNLR